MSDQDARFMRLALSLGRRAQGQTWPNPAVGCVIAQGSRIVGRGWTSEGGRPHAEPQALAQAGAAARGATAYVSLEPCAHHGKTPPCTDALIAAGIARVVAPIEDEDPRVSGLGFARLREAGVEVTTGVLQEEAAYDHAGFFMRMSHERPWVTLKLANSFDGRIATATGMSQWITGPAARHLVHAMRARHDAVMVGGGTARADDPMLTVRGHGRGRGAAQQPVRVVVSRKLDLPQEAQLARSASNVPLWLCHGEDASDDRRQAWQSLGAVLLPCAMEGRSLDIRSVLAQLAQQGLGRVFCEGGSALAASLLSANLVDELVGFTAGVVIGAEGLPSLGAMGISDLGEAPRFELISSTPIAGDVMHCWGRR
ncbi:MAG: bifunctional diaminohydroxyphosphoribosylaminopyrimidine deaminase/5-amino-6-(5-phosphoribosylamino)uracil reductase RibD [Pseudomonadota bacterium]